MRLFIHSKWSQTSLYTETKVTVCTKHLHHSTVSLLCNSFALESNSSPGNEGAANIRRKTKINNNNINNNKTTGVLDGKKNNTMLPHSGDRRYYNFTATQGDFSQVAMQEKMCSMRKTVMMKPKELTDDKNSNNNNKNCNTDGFQKCDSDILQHFRRAWVKDGRHFGLWIIRTLWSSLRKSWGSAIGQQPGRKTWLPQTDGNIVKMEPLGLKAAGTSRLGF